MDRKPKAGSDTKVISFNLEALKSPPLVAEGFSLYKKR